MDFFRISKANYNKTDYYLALISSIIIALKMTQLAALVKFLLYPWVFIIAIYSIIICRSKFNGSSFIAIVFLLGGLISLTSPHLNELFHPFQRYILFLAMFIGFGPLCFSKRNNAFRYIFMRFMFDWILIITILSFISFLLHMPFAYGKAGFKGVGTHSMDLAPLAATATIYMIYIIKNKTKNKNVFIIILIICIMTMLLCASRGALAGFAVAAIFYSYASTHKLMSTLKILIPSLLLLIIIIAWNPKNVMDGLNAKFARVEMTNDYSGGREKSTAPRIREFKENPIFGCGFSSMTYKNPSKDGYFEAGSGWIFILSSTGIVGFISALLLHLKPFLTNRWGKNSSLYLSICVFFAIHSIIEGYILTVGNGLCVLLWTNVAIVSSDYINVKYGEE